MTEQQKYICNCECGCNQEVEYLGEQCPECSFEHR